MVYVIVYVLHAILAIQNYVIVTLHIAINLLQVATSTVYYVVPDSEYYDTKNTL